MASIPVQSPIAGNSRDDNSGTRSMRNGKLAARAIWARYALQHAAERGAEPAHIARAASFPFLMLRVPELSSRELPAIGL